MEAVKEATAQPRRLAARMTRVETTRLMDWMRANRATLEGQLPSYTVGRAKVEINVTTCDSAVLNMWRNEGWAMRARKVREKVAARAAGEDLSIMAAFRIVARGIVDVQVRQGIKHFNAELLTLADLGASPETGNEQLNMLNGKE